MKFQIFATGRYDAPLDRGSARRGQRQSDLRAELEKLVAARPAPWRWTSRSSA